MAIPTWVDTAGFLGGAQDITKYGRANAAGNGGGWTSQRGTTSLVTTGFVADAGNHAHVLDNRDRRFDPNHTTGPYYPDLVPGVPFSKVATFAATSYPVFTGQAVGWPQIYPSTARDQIVNFRAVDAVAAFANGRLAITRPSEYSGARIQAIVTAIGWPGPVAISHGVAIVAPLTQPTVVSWSHMVEVANAEWGDLYIARDGTLTFRDRDLIASETRSSVSQATFTDVAGGTLKYTDPVMTELPIVNDATVNYGNDGKSVNVQDATSIGKPWRLRSQTYTVPLATATAAKQWGTWIVKRYGNPLTTFSSITIKPGRDATNLFPQVLGRELSDLITVTRTPLGGGTALTRSCWIRGIGHAFSGQQWIGTTFALQDASWRTGLFKWDVSVWDGPDVWGL